MSPVVDMTFTAFEKVKPECRLLPIFSIVTDYEFSMNSIYAYYILRDYNLLFLNAYPILYKFVRPQKWGHVNLYKL